jgi:hypothetical protein
VALLATPVRADPSDLVARPLWLAPGEIEVAGTIEMNLAHKAKARPLSLAPDVWVGVAPRWTIGLVHSMASVDRFAPGGSFCVRTDSLYCDSHYRGSGLDVRFAATDRIAPRARVLVRDIDPWKPAVTLGAQLRWQHGRYAITGDPYLQLGLANRDQGNRAQLWLPIQLALQPTCRWLVALDTGINGELAVFDEAFHVPIAATVRARATTEIDVGATLGFASLLGPQNTPKQRVLFLTIGWRR